ncbi:MAG: hypothetical protein DDG60_04225 [Anaerolineae bacterium]|nr:MAG: hypothetical protein DDG60_04225 [Anaerolineae bacterium]
MEENQTPTPPPTEEEEKGPALYNPKVLSLISSLLSILSWVVFAAFIGDTIAQYLNIQNMISPQGTAFSELFKDPGALSYLVTNLSTPFFTGLAWFLVMQGVAIGLNVLMEIDLKLSEE